MENVTEATRSTTTAVTNLSGDYITDLFYIRRYDIIFLYIPVFVLALASNILVIAVVIKYQYMRSVTNYFLVNLAIADLLVTLVCMPIAVWDAYTMLWSFGELTCKLAKFLQGIAVASSVFTITAMAVDRYLSIAQPFGFYRWFNKKTTIIVIIVLWLTSMAIFAPLLFITHLNKEVLANATLSFCQESWENFYLTPQLFGIMCYVVMFAIPGVIMLWSYSLMGKRLCSVKPPFDSNEGSCSTQQSYRLVRERKRVAWILLLLAILFACCWLPYNTINLMIDMRKIISREEMEYFANVNLYMLLLGHFNSALNPIIYCVMSRNFRRSVKEIIFLTRIRFVSKRNRRMQWMDSSGSTLRPNQHQLKVLPSIHNKRPLTRLQSSQKTTKTCAV